MALLGMSPLGIGGYGQWNWAQDDPQPAPASVDASGADSAVPEGKTSCGRPGILKAEGGRPSVLDASAAAADDSFGRLPKVSFASDDDPASAPGNHRDSVPGALWRLPATSLRQAVYFLGCGAQAPPANAQMPLLLAAVSEAYACWRLCLRCYLEVISCASVFIFSSCIPILLRLASLLSKSRAFCARTATWALLE